MPEHHDKNPWLTYLPGLLAGAAAFIAAITTLYINVRGDRDQAAMPAPAAQQSPAVVAAAPVPARAAQDERRLLALEQLRVLKDGSMGSTDWTFEVLADGRPVFVAAFPGLNDAVGKNLVTPDAHGPLSGRVLLPGDGAGAEIVAQGWKRSLIGGGGRAADAVGRGRLQSGDGRFHLEVKSTGGDGAAFVLYFSVAAEPSP